MKLPLQAGRPGGRLMRSKAATAVMLVGTLALASGLTRPLEAPAWEAVRAEAPALRLREAEGALGEGVTLALLGGFRTLAADFCWLRMNGAWERQNLPVTQSLIRLTTAIDPRPLYFWINGARILANDMPYWRIERAGGSGVVPASVQRRFDEEQARVALALLQEALQHHPGQPLLFIEMANIQQRRLGDREEAARLYRQAAEQPDAPHYAARLHGVLLRQLGRNDEAYAWLKRVYEGLPLGDPRAAPEIVLERIRELERELGIPAGQQVAARAPEPAAEKAEEK